LTFEIVYAAAVVLFAYLVRGIAGFGSALLAVPLLAIFFPLSIVVPAVGLLDYIASLSQSWRNRQLIAWRILLPLLPFTLLGVAGASLLLGNLDQPIFTKILGLLIAAYALHSLIMPRLRFQGGPLLAVPAGMLGGAIGTLFGTGGPPYVIYLGLRGLGKAAFRATVATIFVIDGAFRIFTYWQHRLYQPETFVAFLAGVPLLAIGLLVGGRIHLTMHERAFRLLVNGLLLMSGLLLLK